MGQYKIGREAYMRAYREAHLKERRLAHRAWCENNKPVVRMHARTNRYGISRVEYARLIAIKNCEICGEPPCSGDEYLSMDHSHKTNKVRGMLCRKCNSALGLAMDSSNLLRKMARYLEERDSLCQPF
jgi:hypothetical protein